MIKPIFVSHGSPTLPFDGVPARAFLKNIATTMVPPRAILMISAHWETAIPSVNSVAINNTIHDFRGFPPELYQIQYPAAGSAELAQKVASMLDVAGFETNIDNSRGLDHGAWVPLMLAWPNADIPVVQLSLQTHLGPKHHFEIGQALNELANEDILIIGSGSFTHDLSSLQFQIGAQEPMWVTEFANWFDKALIAGRTDDLLNYRQLAPSAVHNHPTDEHLLPIYVTLGAAGANAAVKRIHSSNTFGILRMDAYSFG